MHIRFRSADDGVLSVRLDTPDEQTPPLVRALVLAGADIRAVEQSEHTLEDVYLELLESARARSDEAAETGSKR